MNYMFSAILAILLVASTAHAAESLRLENDKLALRFDAASGTLTAVENKLTRQSYGISGDEVAIQAVELRTEFAKLKPAAARPVPASRVDPRSIACNPSPLADGKHPVVGP